MNQLSSDESTPVTSESDRGYDLFAILQQAQDELIDETTQLELNRPEKLANINDQLEFGRRAAILRGKNELLHQLMERVNAKEAIDKPAE